MKLLLKYLKPHFLKVFVVFALLFGLAMCDLSLPEYMAKIVNQGITNSGINEPIAKNLTESDFLRLEVVLPLDKQELFSNYYLKIESDNATSEQIKKYPSLKSSNVYLLNIDINTINYDFINRAQAYLGMIINSNPNEYEALLTLDNMQLSSLRDIIYNNPPAQLIEYQNSLSNTYLKYAYANVGIKLINLQNSYVINIGTTMLFIALIGIFLNLTNSFIVSRLASTIAYNMRKDVFMKIEKFTNKELDEFSTASLITRTTNDIQQVQQLLAMSTRMIVYSPILATGGIIKISQSNSSLTWIIAGGILSLIVIIVAIFSIVMPRFQKVQKMLDKLNLLVREFLTGQLVIRAFNAQRHQEEKFDVDNTKYYKLNIFINRVMNLMSPFMNLLFNAVIILIFWVGAHQISKGQVLVGDLMSFMQYSMQIIMSFLMISMLAIIIPRASISFKRINEVLTMPISIIEKTNADELKNIKGELKFVNVNFSYPNAEKEVLSNITFTALPNQFTAIIGSTGSGKSTIANLIPRFYDVDSGQILIDDVDIRDVKLKNLRDNIGYIPQKASLFSGTIEDTVKFGNMNASDEEVEQALKTAQAFDFVMEKEEGLESKVAQGGSNFSGGQKQRLSIARALAKKSKIYVLDDTFSALDYKTDSLLRKSLGEEIKKSGATILIIAQRIASIIHCDKIIVLDKGVIVGQGTHQELLKNCKIYQEIANSQLSREELENE